MQSRFAIVLMSVAGAGLLFCTGLLFGLGVMSSPKGGQHKEIAIANEPVKVARQETTGSGDPSRPLTPLTPVHPGIAAPAAQAASAPQPTPAAEAAAQPASAAPVAPKSTPAAAAQSAAATPPKPADAAPKEATVTPAAAPAPAASKSAAAERPAATPPNATPVALHARNSCDVDACSRAYKSFRESDCTYQPYSGPRQLCVSPPPPAREASRGDDRSATVHVHRGARDVEVQTVQREGARATDGASSRDDDGPVVRRAYSRDVTADGEDDGIDDSRVIVRRSDDGRGYDDGSGWHRSFFAPVEDDDDDQ